jgi:hypothetical protein
MVSFNDQLEEEREKLEDYDRLKSKDSITPELLLHLGFVRKGAEYEYQLGPLSVVLKPNSIPDWAIGYAGIEFIPTSIIPRNRGELMQLLDRMNLMADESD